MRRLDPLDIPPEGRYTFIITNSGMGSDGVPVNHAKIEGGQYAGHRVSSVMGYAVSIGTRFDARLLVFRTNEMTGEEVDDDFRDANISVRYSLWDFAKPSDGIPFRELGEPKNKFVRT